MEELKRLRKAKGLSQAKLAALADLDPSTVSQIETGARRANTRTLERLAAALGSEVADLFPLEQPRLPELVPSGQAYFVPLEEGEEEDTITLRLHYVRLFENGEEVVRAMRPATSAETHEMRQRLAKSGRPRE
jgi:transcriptional regulator with XRE-family HTH domain